MWYLTIPSHAFFYASVHLPFACSCSYQLSDKKLSLCQHIAQDASISLSAHNLYLFRFYIIPASPFSPFSPFLPSLPSLPGIPTFPSAPGGPLGPGLPGRPGGPLTLQISRGAPLSLVSNSCPKTQWHRHTTPISTHIFKSAGANQILGKHLTYWVSDSFILVIFLLWPLTVMNKTQVKIKSKSNTAWGQMWFF